MAIDNTVKIILSVKNQMGSGLKSAARSLNKFAVGAQRAGLAMGAGAAVMGTGMFRVLKLVASIDDEFKKIEARTTNITKKGMERLIAQANKLGRTTSFTTREVAALMATLAQGGKSAEDIEELTPKMLNLARATGITADEAARYTQQALAGFGLAATDAGHVADALTVAANSSFQSVEDMGEALKKAALTAKNTGQSFDSTIAAFALLANMGIRGSEAGTQVRRVLIQMSDKGGQVADSLGVRWRNAAGNMKSLPELLADFKAKTDDMGNVEKLRVFNDAFGKIGLNAAVAIGEGGDAFDEMIKAIINSEGEAKRIAELMDSGFGGTLRRLWSAAEGTAKAIGDALVPAVEAISKVLIEALNWLTPIVKKMEGWGTTVVKVFLALAGGAVTLMTLAGIATVLASVLGSLASVVTAVVGVITGVVTGMASFVALLGSIPAILALAAVSIALYFAPWEEGIDGVRSSWKAMMDNLYFDYEAFVNALKGGDIVSAFEIAFLSLRISFAETMNSMSDAWKETFRGMTEGLTATSLAIMRQRAAYKHIFSMQGRGESLEAMGHSKEKVQEILAREIADFKKEWNQFETSVMDGLNSFNKGVTIPVDELKARLAVLRDAARPELDFKKAGKSVFDDILDMAEKAGKKVSDNLMYPIKSIGNSILDFTQKHIKLGEVVTKVTTGALTGQSAAMLQSNVAKSAKDIMKDQLTETKKTNQILLDFPQLTPWGF